MTTTAGSPHAPGRTVIAIELLTAHPDNVRRDLRLDPDFLDSIAELGILTPLRVTPDGAGGYRVIEGHRRLAAAEKLGLTDIPVDLAQEREDDAAGQFLDMYAANHHRAGLSTLEEADALFAASASGATRTRIRKASGLGKEDLAHALKAGQLTGFARETAAAFGQAITLEQAALLAEFSDDTAAVNRLTAEFCNGRSGKHIAEQIRREQAEAAEQRQLTDRLTADGYAVLTSLPPNARMLHELLHDGHDITPDTHAACPGRAVILSTWQPLTPRHLCTSPEANGHAVRHQPAAPLPDTSPGDGNNSQAGPRPEPAPDPARRLVIEGNRAWAAASAVRKRWIADTLLARRTAPREALPFITSQLLTMPRALHDALPRAPRSQLFSQLTNGTVSPDATGAWPAARLPLALLAVIATAYEDRMDGDAGRATWRTDQRYTQCNRQEAGTYLRFLARTGYELSPIEQAVADGVAYTGERPEDELAGGEETAGGDESTSSAADTPPATPAAAVEDA